MSDEPKYRLTPLEEIEADYFISADYYECDSGISVGDLVSSIREICRQEIEEERLGLSTIKLGDFQIKEELMSASMGHIFKLSRRIMELEARMDKLESGHNEIHRVKPGHSEMQFCEKRVNELEKE